MSISTFWSAKPKSNSSKFENRQPIIKTKDLVEILDPQKVFTTTSWTKLRFVGPIFGFSSTMVPRVVNGHFTRKEGAKFLTCIPKQLLGYDYRTKQIDEAACPYSQYITLDSPLLQEATINYVLSESLPNGEALIKSLENEGLKKTYFDQRLRKDLLVKQELKNVLEPIAMRGKEEYYVNVLMYNDAWKQTTPEEKKKFVDMNLRSSTERVKVDFLDYTTDFGEQVFLCDDLKSSLITPVKVLKLTKADVNNVRNNVAMINTSYNHDTEEETLDGIEDPVNGCCMLVQLEEKTMGAKNVIHTKKFMKDERRALSENEKNYMLWNLESLKTKETYEEAYSFLKGWGYINGGSPTKESPVSFSLPQTAIPAPSIRESSLPWEEQKSSSTPPSTPTYSPSSSKAPILADDEEEDIFG